MSKVYAKGITGKDLEVKVIGDVDGYAKEVIILEGTFKGQRTVVSYINLYEVSEEVKVTKKFAKTVKFDKHDGYDEERTLEATIKMDEETADKFVEYVHENSLYWETCLELHDEEENELVLITEFVHGEMKDRKEEIKELWLDFNAVA